MKQEKLGVVINILENSRLHRNPGWFHTFLNSQDDNGNTALHVTIKNKDIKTAEILIDHYNVLTNILNNERFTSLDLAVTDATFDICVMLLKNNAILGPIMYENSGKVCFCLINISTTTFAFFVYTDIFIVFFILYLVIRR